MEQLKQQVAEAALQYLDDVTTLGVGTGSTITYFIQALARIKHRIDGCVASSMATEQQLKAVGLPVISLAVADPLALYIDGADEVTAHRSMIKGGGGALTREKIIANAASKFIGLVDESKLVRRLGAFPVAVEVVPMARSLVARALVKLGGDPIYRPGFITDNGNHILDVHNLNLDEPMAMEEAIKLIPGVVENGIFAKRPADQVIIARAHGVEVF
ncbi:MAG: ribose-5-phosphate isomerase RpiA [Legionellaceae bacterium]|nr:ribose-5-phosphate isomerase RpiA [Legionellaceae bacterium]